MTERSASSSSNDRGGDGRDIALERRFETAADAAGIGVWQWDLAPNTFDYSACAKAIYGFGPDHTLTYEDVARATHPNDRQHALDLARRSLDPAIRAEESYRYRITRADTGEVRWIVAHGRATFGMVDGVERAIRYVGTLQDVTAQQHAEAALAESETRLRLAIDASQLAIWDLDMTTGQLAVSPSLNRMYGFPPDAAPTADELRARYAPGEAERIGRLSAEAVARGETSIEMETKHIWPDGTVKWLLLRAQAVPAAYGSGPRAIGVLLDITQRKLAEDALLQSERRFRMSQEAAGIASLELDVATGTVIGSDMFWSIWGLSKRDSVHISVLENIVVPEDRDIRSTPETRRAGTAAPSVEYRIRRPDTGELRWLSRHIEFTYDADGRPQKMFGIMQDITERKQAQARQQVLMHELEHRIKNILSTVAAIASQTLRNTDLATAREAFVSRLQTLSEAHDLLTHTQWTTASLDEVVRATMAPYLTNDRIAIAGPPVQLTPKMAISLALAVNELATNAMKYGALSVDEGRVDIAWTVAPDATGEAQLTWTWRESGGPVVTPPVRRGFGSVLIERVLATDFSATVRIEYAPLGVQCILAARPSDANLRVSESV